MKGRFLLCFLLVAAIYTLFLTGCPSMSKEEWDRLRMEGHNLLTQALLENYGWNEDDYRIISEKVTPSSAQGFDSTEYKLKIGDKLVSAEVDINYEEVFTDYYGKEFEEALTSYLDRKMEDSTIFQEMSLQRLEVTFCPIVEKYDDMSVGMLPASLTPEGFDTYLKNCEQDGSLYVTLDVAWYSTEAREIPEDLLLLLSGEKSKIPTILTIEHFSCESGADLQPTDWVETCNLYNNASPSHSVYDYLNVSEKLIVRRTFPDYEAMVAGKGLDFQAEFDNAGYLHITPGKEFYDLFFKDIKEGTEIRRAFEEGSEPTEWSSIPKKTLYFDNWYMDSAHGWNIEIKEKY